jgi:hypothetical protein
MGLLTRFTLIGRNDGVSIGCSKKITVQMFYLNQLLLYGWRQPTGSFPPNHGKMKKGPVDEQV